MPPGAGLRPGEVSPVAPNGIPVPGTGAFPDSAIWATAVPLNRRNVAVAVSTNHHSLCAIPVLAAIESSLPGALTKSVGAQYSNRRCWLLQRGIGRNHQLPSRDEG